MFIIIIIIIIIIINNMFVLALQLTLVLLYQQVNKYRKFIVNFLL